MHALLDGDSAADLAVQRAWLISQICEVFGCVPSVAQRELDEDPDRLALLIMDLRSYASAKTAFDQAQNLVRDLAAWKGSPYMTLVETITYERHQTRVKAED